MYKVYLDGSLIYDASIDNMKLQGMKIEMELNKTGSFTFTIFPDHYAYNSINKLKTIVEVYQDSSLIYKGRVLDDEIGFHNEKQVICEGELAFLLDSIQRPYDYSGTLSGYFTQLINNHNSQVEASKRFTIGNITVSQVTASFSRKETEYMTTWDSIQQKLIESNGGYIVIRHQNNVNYIDYLADFNVISTQKIRFGKNLLDMKLKRSAEDIASAVIPLGAKIEGTDERLTIKSVNNNVDYVNDSDAVQNYGLIFKTVIFDDISSASDLKQKGIEYLSQQVSIVNSLDLSAADLATIDESVNSFKVGTYVRVTTEPHSIDQNFLVDKISIDLLNPANNQLTLGTRFLTLVERQNNLHFIKGETGLKGEKGEKGDKGDKGDQGIQGLRGLQGAKGDQGIPGADGEDGQTTYFHIKYSSVANPTTSSQMTETPSDYIGTYVDFTPTDSNNPSSYSWARFKGIQGTKGEQGIPGVNGADGKTSYLHIKYSNDGQTFTGNNGEDVGAWIGTLVDFTQNDSMVFSAYTWKKYTGDVGGRNLIPNTKTMSGYSASSNVTFENDAEGFAVATFARTTTLGWNSINTRDAIPFSVVRGKQVTFSFYVRSDDAEAMTEYDYGMVVGFALCTANSYTRTKYKSQNYYNKKMSSDWEKITWTAKLTDDFFSSGTGTIEDDTRLYLQVYDYTPYSMQVKQIKLEFGNVATDWTPSFDDMAENERIIELERNFNTSIQQNADSILQQVNEDYYLKDNAEALVQSINTRFKQTSDEFEFRFNQFYADIDDVAAGSDAQFQEISKYIRFVDGNIVLGQEGNELTLNIQNDRISFLDDNLEVAYFSNKKLYVTDAEFINTLKLGKFAFMPRTNGNLSFKKVGD